MLVIEILHEVTAFWTSMGAGGGRSPPQQMKVLCQLRILQHSPRSSEASPSPITVGVLLSLFLGKWQRGSPCTAKSSRLLLMFTNHFMPDKDKNVTLSKQMRYSLMLLTAVSTAKAHRLGSWYSQFQRCRPTKQPAACCAPVWEKPSRAVPHTSKSRRDQTQGEAVLENRDKPYK